VCVVRASGAGVDKMLEELWSSGHPVVNVIRFEEAKDKRVFTPVLVPIKPRAAKEKESSSGLYSSS
jgi:hypothetical protein